MAAILLLLPPLLGGMRGITATALVQFLLALIAFVAVSIWMSAAVTGWSLPPVAYAIAIDAARRRRGHGQCLGNHERHLERCRPDAFVALGIACFPALLSARRPPARRHRRVRRSPGHCCWSSRSSASARRRWRAVAKFALDATARQTIAPSSLFDASPWIAEWASKGAGLVTICGQSAKDASRRGCRLRRWSRSGAGRSGDQS